jgi:hypothetical protein
VDRRHDGWARGRPRDHVRGLALLLLLIVVAVVVGALARGPARSADLDALGTVTRIVALSVLGVCVVISIVVLALQFAGLRRARDDGTTRRPAAPQLSRLAKLALVLAAIAIAGGVIALIVFVLPHGSRGSQPAAPGFPSGAVPRPAQQDDAASGGSNSELIVAGVIVLVVLAGLGYLAYRASRPDTPLDGRDEDSDEDADERARLGAAIDDAGLALAAETSPRAAIIACYRSMQGSLAAVGVERTVADTPEELLERATRSGLVLPEAAARLTELFREARFSLHPMSEVQRERAAAALALLRDALAVS